MTSNTRYWRSAALVLVVITLLLATFHHYGVNRRVARVATETAQNSGLLQDAVGIRISMGIFVHGHVTEGTDGGNADLHIPVHGSEGSGMLFAWAQRDRGPWHLCALSFRSNRGTSIVIVADESSHCERE